MTIVLTQPYYYHKKALYSRLVAQQSRSSGKFTLLLLFFLWKVFSSNKGINKTVLVVPHKYWPSDWWHQMAGHHLTSPKVTPRHPTPLNPPPPSSSTSIMSFTLTCWKRLGKMRKNKCINRSCGPADWSVLFLPHSTVHLNTPFAGGSRSSPSSLSSPSSPLGQSRPSGGKA